MPHCYYYSLLMTVVNNKVTVTAVRRPLSPVCFPPRCPGPQVTVTDDVTGLQRCDPSPCKPTSCRNQGACQALSPDSFRCRCQEGFRGQRCELGQVKGHRLAALSPSSILAISMCLLVFFVGSVKEGVTVSKLGVGAAMQSSNPNPSGRGGLALRCRAL